MTLETELEELYLAAPAKAPVKDVREIVLTPTERVNTTGLRVADGFVDWWQRTDIDETIAWLNRSGCMAMWGRTPRKGMLRTAEYIVAAEDEREAKVVWLAAFLAKITGGRDELPSEWRGDPFVFLSKLASALRKHTGHNLWWHHAMTNHIPTSPTEVAGGYGKVGNLPRPTSLAVLLDTWLWPSIEACNESHQIVLVRNPEQPCDCTIAGEPTH